MRSYILTKDENFWDTFRRLVQGWGPSKVQPLDQHPHAGLKQKKATNQYCE
jgi:hypothetical protein